MQAYLSKLRDDMLFERPLEGEDKDLIVWQVLLHVVNHGTDHRSQVLRLLNDAGVKTEYQDYIYVYESLYSSEREFPNAALPKLLENANAVPTGSTLCSHHDSHGAATGVGSMLCWAALELKVVLPGTNCAEQI